MALLAWSERNEAHRNVVYCDESLNRVLPFFAVLGFGVIVLDSSSERSTRSRLRVSRS